MIRLATSVLALALVVAACGENADPGTTPATATTTSPATTIDTTSTTAPLPPTSDEEAVAAAFQAWFDALHQGDLESAWELLAPTSQNSLGNFEIFSIIGTELEEGWGAWAKAVGLEFTLGPEEEAPGGTRRSVELRATVTREGMTEQATSILWVRPSGDGFLVSPFEDIGPIAVEIAGEAGDDPPLPANSGSGRRIVYANAAQRVWLVEANGEVVDSYLVSGRQGVPAPGTYEVFSKSEYAQAGHDDIRMRFMVRFAKGSSGLSIGFHSIPYYGNGRPLQSEDELGEFRSAGCVRQSVGHAAQLYEWADVGTPVVVLA